VFDDAAVAGDVLDGIRKEYEVSDAGPNRNRGQPYCLGAMDVGPWDTPTMYVCSDLRTALDAGSTSIDTADAYSGGESEEIVGKALKGRATTSCSASKVHYPMGDDPNHRGNSRRWIVAAVEHSLRRLQTDHLA